MHIHHKNMKYLCHSSEAWMRKNLSYLGIEGIGCNMIDLEKNTYFPFGCGYDQYCQFMEKKLDRDMASRVTAGLRFWDEQETLFQVVETHYLPQKVPFAPKQALKAFDCTLKTASGFEIFSIVSQQWIQPPQLNALQHWMHAFAYEGAQMKKHKPKAVLELENREALTAQFLNFDESTTDLPVQFQKAKFGDLVLTGKEQAYIQLMVLQLPYREIATKYQV
ncbi:MAG: hypothetical protein ISP86_05115, partial [Shewanellaceae bacterium]|nr:hypothetical protein [Shewanellaceae bacterium]